MPPKYTPNQPQAGRYWPGKPLVEDIESSSDEYEEDEEEEEQTIQQTVPSKLEPVKPVQAPPQPISSAAKLVTTMKTTTISEEGPYAANEEESSEESESEEDELPEKKTSRIRQARKRATGDFIAADQVDLEESSEDESSEEESSEEEVLTRRPLMRPTFVPKSQRDKPQTNGPSIGLAAYTSASTEDTSNSTEQKRKDEAIKFVENEMRNAAQAAYEAQMNSDTNRGIEAVDDTDDLDPAAERDAWKLRELQRIKRERERLIARELERGELEKRRNMEESERLKEDYARVREIEEQREERRGQMDFMQKYYHKGAFYQDEEILQRNYNVATAEEYKNKEALPKSLQVRTGELGRASRTKWTHLTAEDTSKGDSPWFDNTNTVNKRTLGRMGGMHDPNDRERKRRKS